MKYAILLFVAALLLSADKPKPQGFKKASKQEPDRRPDVLQVLIDVLGVNPKPPPPMHGALSPQEGDLWVCDLAGATRQITAGQPFRWPIFSVDGKTIYALSQNTLFAILLSGGTPRRIAEIPDINKLVGAKSEDSSVGLAVLGESTLALISFQDGSVLQRHTVAAADDFLNHLEGQRRHYEALSIFPESDSYAGPLGQEDWANIYVQRRSEPKFKLTHCGRANCTQPSYSPTRSLVVYVKER